MRDCERIGSAVLWIQKSLDGNGTRGDMLRNASIRNVSNVQHVVLVGL